MMKHLGLSHSYDPEQRRLTTQSASSTGRILQELLRKGWEAKPTAWRDTVTAATNYLLPSRAAETQRSLYILGKRTWSQANEQAIPMAPPCDMPGDFMSFPQGFGGVDMSPVPPPPPPGGMAPPATAASTGAFAK